jgi:APA family basic amino acid/polyamine antiporter
LAWTLGGVVALLGAFTFAELGRLRPRAGGQYHILRDAYGRAPAFLFVFCNLTAVQAGGVAIIGIVCAKHLGVALFGAEPSSTWVLSVASASTWALVGLNVAGVRSGSGFQNATVIVKLVTLAGCSCWPRCCRRGRSRSRRGDRRTARVRVAVRRCHADVVRLWRLAVLAVDGR